MTADDEQKGAKKASERQSGRQYCPRQEAVRLSKKLASCSAEHANDHRKCQAKRERHNFAPSPPHFARFRHPGQRQWRHDPCTDRVSYPPNTPVDCVTVQWQRISQYQDRYPNAGADHTTDWPAQGQEFDDIDFPIERAWKTDKATNQCCAGDTLQRGTETDAQRKEERWQQCGNAGRVIGSTDIGQEGTEQDTRCNTVAEEE